MRRKVDSIVVVGAGLGGLAAACHLSGTGRSVTVVEARGAPGGCAGEDAQEGYRFDTGPTVLTMPSLIERCLNAAGTELATQLPLRRVDPMYRACFADGSELFVRHGRDAMRDEVRAFAGSTEAAAFDSFADWLERLYRVEMPHFIERDYDSALDLLRPLAPLAQLARLGAFRRLGPTIARYFADERLRRVFSFQSLYAGITPAQALAVFAVITYMDVVNGVFAPEGGMHALPVALAEAAQSAGVKFRYDAPVERVELERGTDGPARGVRLVGGELLAADAVVVNAELPTAYRTLLPGLRPPWAVRHGAYSPSALLWHVGVRGTLPSGSAHHNIHFGHDWDQAFTELVRDGRRMRDPSFLVSVPSITSPELAPPDRHVLYVLEPVPNLDGRVDWKTERAGARERLEGLVRTAGYPLDIECERLVDPLDWAAQGLERGTPFSLAHRFLQSGPFRPRNVDPRAPGVVFAGAGTVPGVGVPMVLVSGELAARRALHLERA